jgi:hypothetical protein
MTRTGARPDQAEGIGHHRCWTLPLETIATVYGDYEWEVSEILVGDYCAMVAIRQWPWWAAGVSVPSFRHGSIFVTRGFRPSKTGPTSRGKKIGGGRPATNGRRPRAGHYVRGGCSTTRRAVTSIDWIQGRRQRCGPQGDDNVFELPQGYRLTSVPDKSLGQIRLQLLVDGAIGRDDLRRGPPDGLPRRHAGIKRLFTGIPVTQERRQQ